MAAKGHQPQSLRPHLHYMHNTIRFNINASIYIRAWPSRSVSFADNIIGLPAFTQDEVDLGGCHVLGENGFNY